MSTPSSRPFLARSTRRQMAAWSLLGALALARPAMAIPSPDLVIGAFASAAQLLGLLTVMAGGVLFSRRKTPGRGRRGQKGGIAKPVFVVVASLLVVSLVANVLQYAHQKDARAIRLQRNLVRASVENGTRVGDTNLKTLSFSDQLHHPRGLSTEELAQRLAQGGATLIDVREPEEFETGSIAGFSHARYPDLRADPSRLKASDGEIILLCYSGNRSSELADEFGAMGFPCRFVIGGFEKWIAEGRPLEGGRARRTLRSLPVFPNQDRLLDTPEVEDLVTHHNAVFVDVRYESDFAHDHLPGAIDLPLRKLTTPEMECAFRDRIPADRPVIAVCYDKRSSFYGSILGLRLYRRGYEFAGRYTVPHEYMVARAQRPHVQSFLQTSNAGFAQHVTGALETMLRWLNGVFGHLGLAIIAAVALLRLVLLPLTWKNERDQQVLRGLAGEIEALKAETADDRQRRAKAMVALYRRHGVTPGRNLIGTVLQIGLFVLFFAAVSEVVTGSTDAFLWIPQLASRDPYGVLPLVLAGLILVHLTRTAVRRRWRDHAFRLAASVALAAITWKLSAALDLYLVLNVALMMLQASAVALVLARRNRTVLRPARGVVALREAHLRPGTGNKAIRLGRMKVAGLPVPDGFVVTSAVASGPGGRLALTARERRALQRQWRRLRADKVAVRSSGESEDGAEQSFAGVFDSILNVSRDELEGALAEVRASLRSERAQSYGGKADETGGVVVQAMVPAEHAGVLFTEHPEETGSMLVEMVSGLGEALVSGQATPKAYRLGRLTGESLDEAAPPIDLAPLAALSRRVEKLFGRPQDIEWAYRGGRFYLLQARDITASVLTRDADDRRRVLEVERRRLLDRAVECGQTGETLFEQTELSELLPRPTPLSLSLMRSLWDAGGSADLACHELGVPYAADADAPPLVETLFGALYVDHAEQAKRLGRGPGAMATFRLARRADEIERTFTDDFLPRFLRDVRVREAVDLSRLGVDDLITLVGDWKQRFVTETYVEAEIINVAADVYVKNAEQALQRKGLSAAQHLAHIPDNSVARAMALLPEIAAGRRDRGEFVELFGHRAPLDYELSQPRYAESPARIDELLARAGSMASMVAEREAPELPSSKLLRLVVERARRFQALKEDAKHHVLRELSLLRRALVALDAAAGLDGGVFQLTFEELEELRTVEGRARLEECIAARAARAELFAAHTLPVKVDVADLEAIDFTGRRRITRRRSGELAGTLVAGTSDVTGRVRVVADASQIDTFEDGEILVARFTDPTWTPLFPRAAAVITEVGGRLSHAAIVAREMNVTTVVGVEGALAALHTGDVVRLCADGRIERVGEDAVVAPMVEEAGRAGSLAKRAG